MTSTGPVFRSAVAISAIGVSLLLGAQAATAADRVNAMTTYRQGSIQPWQVRPGVSLAVFGNATDAGSMPGDGSAVGETYSFSFSPNPNVQVTHDGSLTGTVTNDKYVVENVTFELLNGSTREIVAVTLTVDDGAGSVDSEIREIDIVSPADPISDTPLENLAIEVNIAIQDGLRYLYLAQQSNGRWRHERTNAFDCGTTGFTIWAFANSGHQPTNDYDEDIYAEFVQKGVDYVLSQANAPGFSSQPFIGNPDADGNGRIINLCPASNTGYATPIAASGIIAAYSSEPDALVSAGAFAGESYAQVIQDVIDWSAYGQHDGTGAGRGGWRYNPNSGADTSVDSWHFVAMEGGEAFFGSTVLELVKQEAERRINSSQSQGGAGDRGQFGYQLTSPAGTDGNATTAGGLSGLVMVNAGGRVAPLLDGGSLSSAIFPDAAARRAAAIAHLGLRWDVSPGTWQGNRGNFYAMWTTARALRLSGTAELVDKNGVTFNWETGADVTDPEVLPPANDVHEGYFTYLVRTQAGDGSWAQTVNTGSWTRALNSAWGVLILQPTVFGPPPTQNDPPLCDAGGPYELAPDSAAAIVPVDGSASSDPDGDPLTYFWTTDHPNAVFDNKLSAAPLLVTGRSTSCVEDFHVYLVVSDGQAVAMCEAPVRLVDETPPTVSVSCGNEVLWPPNHDLQGIGMSVSVDDCDPDAGRPENVGIEVWSDEPELEPTPADGNHAPDAKDFGGCLAVRAERQGSGDGRVYLVAVTSEDGTGNAGYGYCTVLVPQSQNRRDLAAVQQQSDDLLAFLAANPGASPASLGFVRGGESDEVGPKQELDGNPTCNRGAPVLVSSPSSSPPVGAAPGELYTYQIQVIDPENQTLTYTLTTAPAGMTVDANGLIEWVPGEEQIGIHEVVVEIEDPGGSVILLEYLVVVTEQLNLAPILLSEPVTEGREGDLYEYAVEALDLEGDPLSYRRVSGPEGMTVGFADGLVSWTPSATQSGAHAVVLEVCDDLGACTRQAFEVMVAEALNTDPEFVTVPVTVAAEGVVYRYNADAVDADSDVLTYSLGLAPTGMGVNSVTGEVFWTPSASQAGLHDVRLEVTDGRGGYDVQSYTVEVVDALNGAPEFVTTPPTTGAEGALFAYDADAVDPEGAAVLYSLLSAPPGMTLQAASGLLEWTPAADQAGSWAVELAATDSLGASGTQSFTIDVAEALNAPPAFVTSPLTSAVESQLYSYDAAAVDSEGDPNLTFSLDIAPSGMSVNAATGVVTWTPAARHVGSHPVTLRVTDSGGAFSTQPYLLIVISVEDAVAVPDVVSLPLLDAQLALANAGLLVGDVSAVFDANVPAGQVTQQTPAAGTLLAPGTAVSLQVSKGPERTYPLAQLLSPAPESEISGPVEVIGNVLDAGDPSVPLSWEVRIAPFGTTDFRTIGTGTGEVVGGVIAHLDPSLMANGPYRLEILLQKGPFFAAQPYRYHVVGTLKVGDYSVEFIDLAMPLVGVPITISRRYHTLDLSQGDFGAGWRLSLAGDVRDGVPQGQAFTAASRVYVTRPDGKRVGFTFAPYLPSPFFPIWLPAFVPDAGVFDELRVDDAALFNSGCLFFDFATPYNPRRYYFETKEGITYALDELDGLLAAEDRNGSSIVVTAAGITHSSGLSISFERDAAGRITRIVEPDPGTGSPPGSLLYTYDAFGNLASFTDQAGFTTEYLYEIPALPNYLTGVEDPLGRPLVKTVYDAEGRLIAQCDGEDDLVTLEGCVLITNDVDGGVQTILNGRGFRTDVFFDGFGRVTLERKFFADGSFADTQFEYQGEADLVTREIDPNGHATAFTYDAKGNLLTRTDALGNVERFVYNDNNLVTRYTDKLGRVSTYSYNSGGRLLQSVDPAGVARNYTYDSLGRLTSLSDGNGAAFTYTYATSAQVGASVEHYPDGSIRQLEYDNLGHITRDVDPDGTARTYAYDALGRPVSSTRAGATTSVTYNGNTRQVRTRTDALGETYTYEYNLLGRATSVTDPNGGTLAMTYDADGYLTSLTDPTGNVTSFEYDAAGRLVRRTDPTGASTTYAYDAAGNGVEIVDRDGRRRTFEYDALNRVTRELWHDAAGAVVRTLEYAYDAMDNVLYAADDGSALTFTYDGVDRLRSEDNSGTPGVPALELLFAYDGNGDVLSVTDSEGVGVAFAYNSVADLTSVGWQGGIGDGAGVLLGHDPQGAVSGVERFADLSDPSPVSTTAISRDPLGGISAILHSGPAASPVAEYSYEHNLGQDLIRETHHGETVDYTLDALGQLLAADRLGGGDESYSYDASGNRLSSHRHGSQYQTGAGNRLLSNGRFAFDYDGEGNLVRAQDTVTGVVRSYTWDHRNRLQRVEEEGVSGEMLFQALFAYDVFDRRILSEIDADGEGPAAPVRKASVYHLQNVWADFDAGGQVIARYLYGTELDQLLARARATDGVAFHLGDHLGSVRDIVDATGALIDSVDYDAYGNILSETDPAAGDRFKYTGREWEPELALYFLRARYYDPENGRFLSLDPIEFDGGDTNLYRYVFNSPLDLLDPTGLVALVEYGETNKEVGTAQSRITACLGQAVFNELATAGVYIILTTYLGPGINNVYVGSTTDFATRLASHSGTGVGGRGLQLIGEGVDDVIKIGVQLGDDVVENRRLLRTVEQAVIDAFGGKGELLNKINAAGRRTNLCP